MKIGEKKPLEAKHGSRRHLVRQPRHKWFSAPDRKCEDGWYGPHETIEAAVIECASNYGTESPIFVGQGYKLTKSEREDWGAEFDWQVNVQKVIEVRFPNDPKTKNENQE